MGKLANTDAPAAIRVYERCAARAAVGVAALPRGARIEVECIVAL
jgi:enamine deaminase RidA (YjgF/YER057c/UK114 family)